MSYETDGGGFVKGVSINIQRHGLNFSSRIRPLSMSAVEDIAIHHTGGTSATVAQIHLWHTKNETGKLDGYGAAYNFYVRKDGSIHELRGLNYIGSHVSGRNSKSVGVCMEGNYETEVPSDTMYNSVALICAYVMQQKRSLRTIIPHNQSPGSSTSCPGRNVSMDRIRLLTKLKLESVGDIRPVYSGNALSVTGENMPEYLIHPVVISESISMISTRTGVSQATLRSLNPTAFDAKGYAPPGSKIRYPANARFDAMVESTILRASAEGFKMMSISTVTMAMNDEDLFKGASYGNLSSKADYRVTGDGKTITIPTKKRTMFGYGDENRSPLGPINSSTNYDKMKIYVETESDLFVYMFKIDPSSKNVQSRRDIQKIKTKGGFIISDEGRSLDVLSLSGVMLDYNGRSEMMDFMKFYKQNISSGNYKGIYLEMQGVLSMIELDGVSTSEGAENNMIKRYSLAMTILNDNIMSLQTTSGRIGPAVGIVSPISSTNSTTRVPSSVLVNLAYSIGISVEQY